MSWDVIHGDNLEVMRDMPSGSFDLVFTSPPYNLGLSSESGAQNIKTVNGRFRTSQWKFGYEGGGDNMPHDEYKAWQHDLLLECWRLLADNGAIYYNHKPRVLEGILTTPLEYNPGLPLRQIVIWARGNGINWNVSFYAPTCEWILVLAKPDFRLLDQSASGFGDVWRINPERDSDHPAPFPVELPLRALTTTNAQRILDPFCGSGTTGVACLMTGKDFVGIDNSAAYCDMARTRLRRSEGLGYTPSFLADLEAIA